MSYLTERLLNAQYHNHEEDRCCGEECCCHDHEEKEIEQQLSEEEIEKIIEEKYSEKDEKTKEFIRRGLRKFGDRFDYSKSIYTGTTAEVVIICKKHGEFKQLAVYHYRPDHSFNPCPDCKNEELRLNFIKEAKQVHGDKYGYDSVVYAGIHEKVKIYCKECGQFFLQDIRTHLRGCGCPTCGRKLAGQKQTKSFDDFVLEATNKHHGKYSYNKSKDNYKNTDSKIIITCSIHGDFIQKVSEHLRGAGCPHCRDMDTGNRCRLSLEDFIRRSKIIHNNRFDYTNITDLPRGVNSLVNIHCTSCGRDFIQSASSHIRGSGCPYCDNSSSGETLVRAFLEEHELSYREQVRLTGICSVKSYIVLDFVLNLGSSREIWIEYNGEQHYSYVPLYHNNSIDNFQIQLTRDRELRNYCKLNNILLIEIPYTIRSYSKLCEFLDKVLFNDIDPYTLVDYDSLYKIDST